MISLKLFERETKIFSKISKVHFELVKFLAREPKFFRDQLSKNQGSEMQIDELIKVQISSILNYWNLAESEVMAQLKI